MHCRQTLDGQLLIYSGAEARDPRSELIARHVLTDARAGWQRQPEHHQRLWREALNVEVRDLGAYEEVL